MGTAARSAVPFLVRVLRGPDSALVRTPAPSSLTPAAIAPPADSDIVTPHQVTADAIAAAPEVNCRLFAAQALGRLGSAAAAALSDLRDVSASAPTPVRKAAEQAIRQIKGM